MDVAGIQSLLQPSRLVGRDAELAQLGEGLSQALSGSGSVVCVRGAAGVGKSRLLAELAGRCRDRGIAVHRAGCAHAGPDAPLLPALELLRSVLDVSELEDEHDLRREVAGELTLIDAAFHADLPLVFDLLGLPDPELPSGELPPADRRARLAAFVKRLLRASGARGPSVWIVDDVHLVDPMSEGLLREAAKVIGEVPSLLVLGCDADRRPRWIREAGGTWLELAPLSHDATRALLRELLGDDPSLRSLSARIAAACAGRPWLARESVRLLAETGVLSGEAGRFRCESQSGAVEVPTDEATLLRDRLASPGELARRTLELAAVIGTRVPHALLVDVSEDPAEPVDAALEELCRLGILYPAAAEVRFEHALYRDAAYAAIDPARRAKLHGEVALAIEEVFFERVDALAGWLAHHWSAAGQAASAERWWRHAAARAGHEGGPPAV